MGKPVIIGFPMGGYNAVEIDTLLTKIRSCLGKGAQPPAPAA